MTPDTATARPPTSRVRQDRAGVVRFTHALVHMDGRSIESRALALKARRASADDDVAWWEATLTLDRVLRQGGLRRQAAMAAHLAAQAVLAAAARAGLAPTPDVTAVARSAAEAARALTGRHLMSAPLPDHLTSDWNDLLVPAAEFQIAGRSPGGRRHRTRAGS